MPRIAVVADDLSGAVESAAVFMLRTTRIVVTLSGPDGTPSAGDPPASARGAEDADVVAVDTDSRQVAPIEAGRRVAAAMAALADVPVVVKKIDSLLRGNVAAEVSAIRADRPHVVMAPALPAAGRTVRDGQVYVGEEPLHRTDIHRAEAGPPPGSIGAVLGPLRATPVPLDVGRGPGLGAVLAEILSAGDVPVCDGRSDSDLDAVVAASAALDRPVLVGSAGLAAAVARGVADGALGLPAPGRPGPDRAGGVLAVVGSAAPGIADQLAALVPHATVLRLRPAEMLAAVDDPAAMAGLAARVTDGASADVLVVTVDPAEGVDPAVSRTLSTALTSIVADAASRAAGLVLTGGETARAVLDRLGVTGLRPLTQVHHGAVVCVDDAGRAVATRPGSYGDRDSLLQLVTAVRAAITDRVPAPPVHAPPPHPPEESA